jgi:hypothetical protein
VAFSEQAFAVVCRLIGPRAAGWLCALFVRPGGGTEGPACLCIDRDIFSKDIAQLRARTTRPWPSLTQQLVFLCEAAWLPRSYFRQTEYQAALPTLPAAAVDKAERFAVSLLRAARARHGVGAVITGNVDYAPDEFLRRAAQKEGMPFLVLLKEHAVTDYGHREFAKALAGYRYHGDAVAVFGKRTAVMLLEESVCEAEQISITGPPRLDEWIEIEPAPERDLAVLFSFSRKYQEGAETFEDVLDAFIAAAASRTIGTEFVVKCRDPYEEAVVAEMVARRGAPVVVTSTALVPALLRRANVVVGFSSLAMIEALLSWGVLISPRFGTCSNDQDAQFDDRDTTLNRLVRFVGSAQELTDAIIAAVAGETAPPEHAARRVVVQRMFCEPAPTFSARVDAFVGDAIAKAANAAHGDMTGGRPAVPSGVS